MVSRDEVRVFASGLFVDGRAFRLLERAEWESKEQEVMRKLQAIGVVR